MTRLGPILVSIALLLAACGDDDDTASTTSSSTTTETTTVDGKEAATDPVDEGEAGAEGGGDSDPAAPPATQPAGLPPDPAKLPNEPGSGGEGGSGGSPVSPEGEPTPAVPSDDPKRVELEEARAKFEAQEGISYSWIYRLDDLSNETQRLWCFEGVAGNTERNDQGACDDIDGDGSPVEHWFGVIETYMDQGGLIEATYHPDRGHPVFVEMETRGHRYQFEAQNPSYAD